MPDEIIGEIIKLIDDDGIKLLNRIYKIGYIPKEWLVSNFVMLPITV